MISKWAYNQRMPFNPDLKKLAQKILFSRKNSNITHPTIHFNNVQVQRANQQRHLGIILDEMLIKRLRNPLPGKSLITIYKAIIRPHPDYGDILYDQPNINSFCQKKINLFNTNQLLELLVQFKVPHKKNNSKNWVLKHLNPVDG